MLDDMHITEVGQIKITSDGVIIEDFDAECDTCREIAVLALIWGIGELQRELAETLKVAGGSGKVVVN